MLFTYFYFLHKKRVFNFLKVFYSTLCLTFYSGLASKLFFLAVQRSGALLSRNLDEEPLYKSP